MFLAMRREQKIIEGDNLDQVVIAAESFIKKGCGDIIVWDDDGYIVAEIEDQGDSEDSYTVYTGRGKR